MFRRSITKIQGQVLLFYVWTMLSMRVLAPIDAFLEEKRNIISHTVGSWDSPCNRLYGVLSAGSTLVEVA